jgi:hypothetical protein
MSIKEEMKMEKVMISKEEAVALENALEISGGDKSNVVQWHARDIWDGKQAPLNDLGLDEVCTALYVGYEIEPGPEEEALDYYQKNPDVAPVIGDVLNILNIQIKGINCL